MRVFITGIAGFIGSTLAAHLSERHDVTGCDDLSFGKPENVPDGIGWQKADVYQLDHIDADVICHLAALSAARHPDQALIWHKNLGATAHLFRIAGNRRVVFASTCVATNPTLGAYAGSKWSCEQLAASHRVAVLRFANVYGPRQRDWGPEPNVLAAWQRAVREGKPIRIDGDGSQTRDFIHVDDVARAIGLAAETSAAEGKVLDVCTGTQTSIAELAEHFDAPRTYAPRNPVDPDATHQDPQPAREVLGFEARIPLTL